MKVTFAIAALLATTSAVQWKPRKKMVPRRIIDADGDGVEDNRAIARKWLDKFHEEVYGDGLDDIHNTHNGELPGHERWGEDPAPGEKWVQTPETKTKFLLQMKDDVSLVNTELNNGIDDRSENEGDTEMVQLNESNQNKLFAVMQDMDGPEANDLLQYRPFKAWRITDEDGDGVEDNQKRTFWELDRFNKPNRFFPLEDLHNTHHGNLPGHVQKEWDLKQGAPEDHYTLTKRNWNRYGN